MTSCTLHKLIESIEGKTIRQGTDSAAETGLFEECVERLQILAPRAMCFHMGHESLAEQFQIIPELFRLPYDVCWFEGGYDGPNGEDGRVGFFCENIDEYVNAYLFGWNREFKTWVFHELATVKFDPTHPDRLMGGVASKDPDLKQAGGQLIGWLAAFLSALNCTNIKRIKTDPDDKLQKARSVRGKKPLFSFWTLEFPLDQEEMERVNLGGTHASPRGHLRRGHARRLPSGHWTWVRACAVGNLSLGIVHKDYQAV